MRCELFWLCLGVLIWSATHFLPAAAPGFRGRLVGRLGEQPYKGLFSLLLLAAIAFLVIGWRASPPALVYPSPEWLLILANIVVLMAFVLFVASAAPSNLKRVIRHPQLTAVILWSGAHLCVNRDWRSLVLFGGLGLWAIVMVTLLNRRDGAWVKPESQPIGAELKVGLIAVAAFALVFFLHGYLFGVSPLPF